MSCLSPLPSFIVYLLFSFSASFFCLYFIFMPSFLTTSYYPKHFCFLLSVTVFGFSTLLFFILLSFSPGKLSRLYLAFCPLTARTNTFPQTWLGQGVKKAGWLAGWRDGWMDVLLAPFISAFPLQLYLFLVLPLILFPNPTFSSLPNVLSYLLSLPYLYFIPFLPTRSSLPSLSPLSLPLSVSL